MPFSLIPYAFSPFLFSVPQACHCCFTLFKFDIAAYCFIGVSSLPHVSSPKIMGVNLSCCETPTSSLKAVEWWDDTPLFPLYWSRPYKINKIKCIGGNLLNLVERVDCVACSLSERKKKSLSFWRISVLCWVIKQYLWW